MLLRIPRMARVAQTRKGKHTNYTFFQNQWTKVENPDDLKEFLEGPNKDIFEVLDDKKSSKEVVDEKKKEAANTLLKPYTKDEAYTLSKDQQIDIIKQLGANPKDYPQEKDRVKFIVDSLKSE